MSVQLTRKIRIHVVEYKKSFPLLTQEKMNGFQTKSNARKILQRLDEETEQESKRSRTPDIAPMSTTEELMDESCFVPRTPEGPPPSLADVEDHSPSWRTPKRPLDILGGQYPDPISMDFKITKSKKVTEGMDVYFIGIRHGFQQRPWDYKIQSPPSNVQFVTSKYHSTDYTRVLISPVILDGTFTAYPAEFMAFVDHVERLSARLKSELEKNDADTTNWKAPLKYSDGICTGIYAKLKNVTVREHIRMNPNRLKCALKLSCVYVGSNVSGLTFELVQAFP